MITPRPRLKKLAAKHGTPLFVDRSRRAARRTTAMFRKYLPRVQAYYAVKANPDPAIVRTLYQEGASFDVASMPEFKIVYENIKHMPGEGAAGLDLGQDHLRQSRPSPSRRLKSSNQYKPLVTFDNFEEIKKIKKHAPHAGLALRLKVPNTGAMVELSSKFGASPGRGRGPDSRGGPAGPDGRGHQLPRRQPDDQFRELRPGASTCPRTFSRKRATAATTR